MDRRTPSEYWVRWVRPPEESLEHNRCVMQREYLLAGAIDTQYDYLTPYLKEWISSDFLSLIVVHYPTLTDKVQKALCVDLIELFQDNNIPVIWLMRGSETTPPQKPITTYLLKSLIMQVMQLPQFPKQAPRLIAPSDENENGWFESLGAVLAQLEEVFIVIDSTVLKYGRLSDTDVCNHWIGNLLRICDNHRRINKGRYPPKVGVKVTLAAHDLGMIKIQQTQQYYNANWLYVDITQSSNRLLELSSREEIVAPRLEGVVQAYNDTITARCSRKSRERYSARHSIDKDGVNGPPPNPTELSAQEAFPTSSSTKQPSVRPSQDKVAKSDEKSRKAGPSTSSHSKQPSIPLSRDVIEALIWIFLGPQFAQQPASIEQMQMSLRSQPSLGSIRPPIVPTSATQTPRSQLPATFSQQSQAQPAESQPTSLKTECVPHKSAASVSIFEMFDNRKPSGDAADKADKADMWFKCLRDELHPALPRIPDKKDRVRIAVLDTGICMDDNFIHLKENRTRITYQSFVTGDPNPTVPSDLVGHGTHVAGLLLQVAQNADIYVAKISDKDGLHDPQEIAKAIRHAVDSWHVHIISMSFGFNNLTQKLDCIKRAILHAHSNETVLFAAARNNGGVKGIAYPASQTEVICINSTDGEGNPSPFNPSSKEDKNFSTLGEAVLSSWPRSVQQRMTGTSFATPIAAGIAAVTMDYMEQKKKDWSEEDDRMAAKALHLCISSPSLLSILRPHLQPLLWDIPPEAISLGSLIADPTEPHRPLNATPPLRQSPTLSQDEQTTSPPGLKIDSPIYATTFSPFVKEATASKKKSFSLIAQLSLLTGVGGSSSFSSARDEGLSYRARSMHSEWFAPSPGFISAAVAQPEIAGFLAMLPSKRPIYMATGVRHVAGFTASSRLGKERTGGGGVNADATALGVPLAVGVNAERAVEAGDTVEWECEGPIVFVYQLERLTRRNEQWDHKEYNKGTFMGVGEAAKKDEWVVEGENGILEGLDEDELEIRGGGWDDLEEEECVMVVPRV
ncbi:hypothetical protein V502_06536 [Pseudogymnoascus sp. VKM F-4520 (FW-2644)]|nr:hypothetical protein V502_06536 [Pseudogymnoascus sp. VKM F-4520 (FW-2644)]